MAKPRTVVQLVELLDRELSWRRLDLLFAARLVQRATGADVDSSIRAAVPLLYAHWEGFVKKAANHYCDFLSSQRLRFSDVNLSFSGLRAHSYVAGISEIRKKIYVTSELLGAIKDIEHERLNISVSSHIDKMGNLSYDMLNQIVQFLSLPVQNYVTYKALIDEALLNHRNKIAHGEFLDIGRERYSDMHREVVAVIDLFKADIEDAATERRYRRTV